MKKSKITILDLGYGNFKSLLNAFDYLNIKIEITNNTKKILQSDMLFLPGVGAYDTGIKSLKKNNLIDAIKEVTEIKHRKILGICLGMQLMCSSSDEGKIKSGLNFFDLKISKLKKKGLKVPHIGFNKVTSYNGFSLSKNLDKNYFYFAHSYCAKIKKTSKNIKYLECSYGNKFFAGIEKENFFGLQFHPEKSQSNGIKILENFYNY